MNFWLKHLSKSESNTRKTASLWFCPCSATGCRVSWVLSVRTAKALWRQRLGAAHHGFFLVVVLAPSKKILQMLGLTLSQLTLGSPSFSTTDRDLYENLVDNLARDSDLSQRRTCTNAILSSKITNMCTRLYGLYKSVAPEPEVFRKTNVRVLVCSIKYYSVSFRFSNCDGNLCTGLHGQISCQLFHGDNSLVLRDCAIDVQASSFCEKSMCTCFPTCGILNTCNDSLRCRKQSPRDVRLTSIGPM